MRCRSVEQTLSAFIDGELPSRDRDALQAHLGVCSRCARRLQRMQAVRERVRLLGTVKPSAGFDERVRAAMEAPRPDSVGKIERLAAGLERIMSTPARRTVGAAAAGLLIAFALILPSTGVDYEVQPLSAAGTAPGSRLSVSVDRMLATVDRIAPIEIEVDAPFTPGNGG